MAQPNHWTERGRSASVSDSETTGRPRRSVLTFGQGKPNMWTRWLTRRRIRALAALGIAYVCLWFVTAQFAGPRIRRVVFDTMAIPQSSTDVSIEAGFDSGPLGLDAALPYHCYLEETLFERRRISSRQPKGNR